jgi:hypothetical protein
MRKFAIVLVSGILTVPVISPQARSQATRAKETVKISGRVTDFEGRPIEGASVELKNSRFDNAAQAVSDRDGRYSLIVPKGIYMALTAVKDYQVKFLEYWAWTVPAEQDLEINPRFDRLEVYAMNAWSPQGGYPSYQIYFRPMSLTRTIKAIHEAGGMEDFGKLKALDIAPELQPDDIRVSVDGQPVMILQLNGVREASGPDQSLMGYLIQVSPPSKKPATEYFPITISLTDRATGERGEGCLFFRPPRLL